jgi:DNA-directed RNA polymerase specialized sigma subunit
MSTKDYLSQAYRIDQRINSKLAQVMSLRDLLGKATGTLSGAPKAATPNSHSMEDTIAKMVDLENEINEDIDALVDLKKEIMLQIKRVENTEYQTILELRYLCFKRWEEVSVELGYSMQHLFRLHDEALGAVSFSKR